MDSEKKFIKDLLGFYQNQLLAGYYRKRGKAQVIPNIIFCLDRLSKLKLKRKIKVLDIGCGKGNLLKVTSALVNSMGIKNLVELNGLDFDEDLINQAKQEDGHGITYLHRDLRYDLLEDIYGKFDLILCVNTLHEVFSSYLQDVDTPLTQGKIYSAKTKVFNLSDQIGKLLSEVGSMIFYDGLNLSSKQAQGLVKFKIKTKILNHDFNRFIKEYGLGRINYQKTGNTYVMSGSDFLKFIGTFKYLHSKLWPIESQESYFYFNQAEIRQMIEKMGLLLEYKSVISNDLGLWQHHVQLMNKTVFPNKSILLVASKRYLYSEYDYFC